MALISHGQGKEGPAGNEAAVLVIEPNEEHQVLSTMALGRRGFRVTIAGTAREGMRLALSQTFQAVVLDYKVRDMPALEVLAVLAERRPEVPKIFVVASGQEPIAVRALASGASGYLVKTARYNELLPSEVETQIRAAAARKSLKEQKRALGESEERFQKAFRASPLAVTITGGPDMRFVEANDAFLRLVGFSRDEVIGRTHRELADIVPDEAQERATKAIQESGSVRDAEIHVRTKPGEVRTVSISVDTVEIDGVPCLLTIMRDVTEERQSERLRSSLYDLLVATESASDLPDLYRRIHEIVARLMPAENFYIALHDPETDEVSFPYFLDEKEPTPAPYRAGRGLTEYVLRTGEPLLVSPQSLTDLVAQGKVEVVGAEGVDWVGVPLNVGGRTIGVLAVQSYSETRRYTEREKEVLAFVSAQVAQAIDRKRSQDAVRQAETRFRTMFQEAPMGILLVGPEGRIQESNPAFRRMLGYGPGELRGVHLRDITVPEDVDESLRLYGELIRGERDGFVLEKRYLRKDGSPIWARLTATSWRPEGSGEPAGLGMVEDVTEARKAEEARDADARRFAAMIQHISDGVSLLGPDGKILWQSPSATRLFGYTLDEVRGKPGFEHVHPDDAAQLAPVFADLLASPGKNVTAEFRIRHRDGSERWMEAIGSNLLDDPVLHAVVMNYRDITERNEALEQIRFQASLLGQVRNAVIAIDRDMRVVHWNQAAVSMYGWSVAEALGKPVAELLLPPEGRAEAREFVERIREVGHWEGERGMARKDGSRFPAEVSITALRDLHDRVIGFVGISSDVTERVAARHELEVRAVQQATIATLGRKALVEPRLSSVMNESVGVLASTLGVEYASVLELLPDDAVFKLKAGGHGRLQEGDVLPNEPRANMAAYALSVKAPVVLEDVEHETRFAVSGTLKDEGIRSGVSVVIPGPKRPYGVLCVHSRAKRVFSEDDLHFCESIANVIADALERNRIEKILGENERMASMGQLAAYVAHEVNTPLTNISLLASSVARREKDPEILGKIAAIGEQRRRATSIIMDLLEFPRQGSSRRAPEDVRKVIAAAVEQVGPFRQPGVDLVVDAGDHAVFANMDVIQIRDVFVNLLKNALEATAKGRVTVSLKEWPDFLFVSIIDTGTGMPPEVLEQLLHPGPSLKASSEGPAVGLAVSRTILAAHGGKIEATSEVGKGSTFTVVLPRFEVR